jgi:hypothetical protein
MRRVPAVAAAAALFAALASVIRPRRKPQSSANDGKRRVALAVTGSVASIKAPQIAAALVREGLYVDVVLTGAGSFFQNVLYKGELPGDQLRTLEQARDAEGTAWVSVWRDEDEW